MRLTAAQQAAIVSAIHEVVGAGAQTFVYGSRLDDAARGGDVDLLVLAEPMPTTLHRARIKTRLEGALRAPVDVLADRLPPPHRPFVELALAQAQRLG